MVIFYSYVKLPEGNLCPAKGPPALKGPFSTAAPRSARLVVPPKPKDDTPAHIARCAVQVSS